MEEAALVIELVALQRGIAPATQMNWSDYVLATVFSDGDGRQRRLRESGEAATEAVEALLRLAEPYRGCPLPQNELVHGDLNMSNLLCTAEKVAAAIDIEAVGRGTACFDLLTATREGRLLGGTDDDSRILEQEAMRVYGPSPGRSTSTRSPEAEQRQPGLTNDGNRASYDVVALRVAT